MVDFQTKKSTNSSVKLFKKITDSATLKTFTLKTSKNQEFKILKKVFKERKHPSQFLVYNVSFGLS